jgi:hypothetical protein
VRCRAHLETIGTPDVPFCAAGKVATAVVLARRSAPERIRPAAPKHRLPSAVPHAVRPALAASRACSCCCAPTRHFRACGKTRTERPVVFWCSTAIPQLSRSREGPFETGCQAVSLQLPTGQGCRCGRWDGLGAERRCVVCRPRGGRKRHKRGTRFPRASRHVDHPRGRG